MSGGGTKRLAAGWSARRIAVVLLVLMAGLAVPVLWFAGVTVGQSDPLFRGKPESDWIKNLKYSDDEQVKEWRGYGADGVQVLIRGLEQSRRPGERAYRGLYRNLPWMVGRWLPTPKDDSTRASRMCLVSLLGSLEEVADRAKPIMMQTLIGDEDASVRQSTINFFTRSEDAKCPLNRMTEAEKKQLLPALIRSLQDTSNWGLRNNAANALRYFPEYRAGVAPALTNAVHDPQPEVALLAAKALNAVAPDLITNVGAVTIAAQILQNPDGQIAYRAAEVLGQMRAEPTLAVPALIEGMKGTNRLVATYSAQALMKFDEPAGLIRPALVEAVRSTNLASWLREPMKKRIETMTVTGQGPN